MYDFQLQPSAEEIAPPEEALNPVSKDPRYIKFFKMLQFVSIHGNIIGQEKEITIQVLFPNI